MTPRAAPETDAAYGARIMASVRCCECGSPDLAGGSVAPGHEGFRVNLLGESSEGPDRSFALTPDRPVRAWCAACWPWSPQNTAGSAHGASSPAAEGRA